MPLGLGQLTNLQSLVKYVLSTDSRRGGELKELHGLNHLRENLRIKSLRHDKDIELECKATSLNDKQHFEGLALEWIKGDVDEVDVGYNKKSIEALEQPLILNIWNYKATWE